MRSNIELVKLALRGISLVTTLPPEDYFRYMYLARKLDYLAKRRGRARQMPAYVCNPVPNHEEQLQYNIEAVEKLWPGKYVLQGGRLVLKDQSAAPPVSEVMSEATVPSYEKLQEQIIKSLDGYCRSDKPLREAMLSGMSLVADFLAKVDGSKSMRPQTVVSAINEVAKREGMEATKIR